MLFSLLVRASPIEQSAYSALSFAEALLAQQHKLHRVFFYGDAVWVANSLNRPAQDELNIQSRWQQLAEQHQLDLVVCIGAAAARGVMDESEADRYEADAANLAAGFALSGLGQLAEALAVSDRVITFGG